MDPTDSCFGESCRKLLNLDRRRSASSRSTFSSPTRRPPPIFGPFPSFPVLLRPKSVNQSLLFKAIRSRSLPRLRQVTVLPLGAGKDFEEVHHWQQVTAQEELIEFCGPYGIKIERIGIIGQWYHQGYGLEPLQEGSTTDH